MNSKDFRVLPKRAKRVVYDRQCGVNIQCG